jgi:arylsulfatase
VQQTSSGETLPRPEPSFGGTIAPDYRNAREDYPQPIAPQGATNVVVILLDDCDFDQPGTFGGPIPTREALSVHFTIYGAQRGFGSAR